MNGDYMQSEVKKLTHEEWWTDVEVTTDEKGVIGVEAFKGDYEIIVGDKKCEAIFDDDSDLEIRI